MSNLSEEFLTLLTASHSDPTSEAQLFALIRATSYSDNQSGQLVELLDNSYFPATPSGKFVSQSDVDLGCGYCTVCGQAVWSQYMNPVELATCYYCAAPSGPVRLMSIHSIVENLSNIKTLIVELQGKVTQLQTTVSQLSSP